MFIDTHAHLGDVKLLDNIENILLECKRVNVEKIISIGCSLSEIQRSSELANFHDNIYFTAGLYPHDNEDEDYKNFSIDDRIDQLLKAITSKKCVAIGECGLDYSIPPPFEKKRTKKAQKDIFLRQINISKEINKPIIIHSRDAKNDTLDIIRLEYYMTKSEINGVWHCYSEDLECLKIILDYGFFISTGGMATYSKYTDLMAAIKYIPLDRLVLETDSPYLLPKKLKNKGLKINTPASIPLIATSIAEIKGLSLEKIENEIYTNSLKLFKL